MIHSGDMQPEQVVQCATIDSKWTLADLSMAKLLWTKILVFTSEGGRRNAYPTKYKEHSGAVVRERLAWNDLGADPVNQSRSCYIIKVHRIAVEESSLWIQQREIFPNSYNL